MLERRHKLARFRDPERSLDTFDFDFNKKMNRALVYDLATTRFIAQREDVLFLAPTSRSHSRTPPGISPDGCLFRRAMSLEILGHIVKDAPSAGVWPVVPAVQLRPAILIQTASDDDRHERTNAQGQAANRVVAHEKQ